MQIDRPMVSADFVEIFQNIKKLTFQKMLIWLEQKKSEIGEKFAKIQQFKVSSPNPKLGPQDWAKDL